MTPEDVALKHYATTLAIQTAATRAVQREWAAMPQSGAPADLVTAYTETIGPKILALLVLAQLAASEESDGYLDGILDLLFDSPARPFGRIDPRAFAYTAADGRDLESLLMIPLQRTVRALNGGTTIPQALTIGSATLGQIVTTEVRDASRTADGVALVARPQIAGYVRMLTPPSCPRCVVLAGRFYRWNAGFQRHPNCDCIHVPATEDTAGDSRTDPRAAVLAGEVEGLSKAEERAIRDGADVSQVVNSRRGMYTAGGLSGDKTKFTTEGTSRRGFAARRFRNQTGRGIRQRLRPESIYKIAGDDRDEALRLLRLHGYLL